MTKKTEEKLEWVPYIQYSITFKNQNEALLNSESEVNAMSQVFAYEFNLKIWKNNVGAWKIDGTILKTYRMIVSTFFVSDMDDRERFFEKRFLIANVKPNILLKMPFLTMNNVDIDFQA